jgi:hypothetical protein
MHTPRARLGLFQSTPKAIKEQRQKLRKEEIVTVHLLHRTVPVKYTDEGILCENLCAYSHGFRTVIPMHPGHPFRCIPDSHSD